MTDSSVRVDLDAIEYDPAAPHERVIMLRLPLKVHEQLKADAHEHYVSLQRLVTSKVCAAIPLCELVEKRDATAPGRGLADRLGREPERQRQQDATNS
mgnify:CR=1 FL=1